MKFSLTTVVAFAGLLTSVFAGPVPMDSSALEARQYDSASSQLDQLTIKVDAASESIKNKLASLSENSSDQQKADAANAIAPDLETLQAALKAANSAISANGKRSEFELEARTGCPSSCMTDKANKIVVSISISIKLVVKVFGPRHPCVTRYVHPVLIELRGLLGTLDRLISGLLRLVGTLLASLLGGCGLDDILYNLLGSIGGLVGTLLGGLLGGLLGTPVRGPIVI